MPTFPPSPWKEFLEDLDAVANEACRLPCFGGFAVTLGYGISRMTSDIDVLDVAPPRMVATLMREGGRQGLPTCHQAQGVSGCRGHRECPV